jgi:hypothetical protein
MLQLPGKGAFESCGFGEAGSPFFCYLEFIKPDKKPLECSEGGMEIKFCPWCGLDLRDRYAPDEID